jgi:hypothetical protein
MELTKISDENINTIFNYKLFEIDLLKKINNKHFIEFLYKQINNATKFKNIEILQIEENIEIDISRFIDNSIAEYILKQKYIKYRINIKIENKTFIIYVFTEKNININKVAYYLKIILYICNLHTTHKESIFTFKIFLTDFAKTEPKIQIEPININSGYTINHKTIVIYRKEELLKVFIHECFHLFCLDFSNVVGINYSRMLEPLFKVKSDYLLFESYCEYWSRTLNTAIVSFHIKENITFNDFKNIFELNINIERCFSLLQMIHFLKTMNLTYSRLLEGKELNYKENTNGLCYYVLTSLLMYNFEETMNWFIKHNQNIFKFSTNEKNIYLFFEYIKSIYNKKDFLLFLKNFKTIPIRNMYMSVFEINLFD